jgi:hypothetical protein
MKIEPEISFAAIVLRGKFNPAIFQPFWFVRHDLISDRAGNAAQMNFIHPEVAAFQIDGHFTLHVDLTTFSITRLEAPLVTIADLVGRIFGDLLPHTPVGQVGINRAVHFSVGSAGERNRIGKLLAPREPWGTWGADISAADDSEMQGGLRVLTMAQYGLKDRKHGSLQATIEPSVLLSGGRTGIYMAVNDHYQLVVKTKRKSPEHPPQFWSFPAGGGFEAFDSIH